ncbi:FMN-binding protein [Streptomyces sp. SID4985]|uniref:FMN-binding protein n=1 Tax=Streptomyces sp. SID4985 TaxID=2690292 RepID=UPI0013685122|nr:FMN-binding protein [Streptomyces sp. SID4985]
MHPLRKNRPLRRTVLACAAAVAVTVLPLSLKPHTNPALAAVPPQGSAGAGTGSRTVTGDTAQTRWGPVQVRVTLDNGRLTDVTAVRHPSENSRDQEINAFALPRLRAEALAAQSADIDTVSGATYTSTGYRQSLQSALDSAAR